MKLRKGFRRILTLILSIALLSGFFVPFSVAIAQESALPDAIELQWPDVTGDTVGNLWYKFDEPAGSTAAAISNPGNSRNTVNLTGHTFVPDGGVDGGAIRLNGAPGSRILINNDNAAQTGTIHGEYQNASVAFWFKPERLTGEQVLLLWGGEQGANNSNTGDIRGLGIRLNGDML